MPFQATWRLTRQREGPFDEKLEGSVIIFQKRHGLQIDGIVGPETLAALNVRLKQRIRQIELNMERLRWVGGSLEPRSVVINIANFRLDAREGGRSVLSMKVVVGKPYWDTPVFGARMTHLVLNPSWNAPDSIAKKRTPQKDKKGSALSLRTKHNGSQGLGE